MLPRLTLWGVPGIPEVQAGDDLVGLIGTAIEAMIGEDAEAGLRDGDIVLVTSKIVSKAEGRQFDAADRDIAIAEETVRVVAERAHPGGLTQIVATPQGLVLAAAGIDTSNVPDGVALRLPVDPDRSAQQICAGLRARYGLVLGVIITDTLGRAWRIGQTDSAIGAAGVQVMDDLRGGADANGRALFATIPAVADELAAAADLVKGKASQVPVAIARGLSRLVTGLDAPGARALVRPIDEDMFRLGTQEAYRLGYETAKQDLARSSGEPKTVLYEDQD